jgi:MFS family permease
MQAGDRTARTFYYERWRAVSNGVLETAGSTFLLLIAVRGLEAGATAKALVAGGGSVGLLLSPFVVSLVTRSGHPAARAAFFMALGGALCFLIMAAAPSLPVFVAGSVLSMAAASAAIPLLTQVYQENYPEDRRGQFFAQTVMIRIAVAAGFSEFAGRFLSNHFDSYRFLLLVFAAAFALSAACLARCPSRPLTEEGGTHPFRALRFVGQDRLFRHTLICWMLMGFANLMMLPMRVEFLANPRYGLALSPSEIAFLIGVVPNAARLAVSPIWGYLFDRTNFFVLRVILNLGFALGILAFFTSDSVTGLILGALIYGVSNGGGDVAWGLWVTKFAPPRHVADYMSVHTFFTGVRGVIAPLVAFHLVAHTSVFALAWTCAALILLSALLLLPETRAGRFGRAATAWTEEVSE